jgi:PST family polysaccharide transporter
MLVGGGAIVGQRWGIVGVAWFVLGALAVNYLLMAQLSLSEAAMSWAGFWRAHLPAARLAVLSGPLVWGLATLLRHEGVPSLITLAAGATLMLGGSLLLAYAFPRVFLGDEGLWMLDTMRGFAAKRTGGEAATVNAERTA